jgi:hypothetical protein
LNIIFTDKQGNRVTVTALSDIRVKVDKLPFADAPQDKTKTNRVWYKPWTWA